MNGVSIIVDGIQFTMEEICFGEDVLWFILDETRKKLFGVRSTLS